VSDVTVHYRCPPKDDDQDGYIDCDDPDAPTPCDCDWFSENAADIHPGAEEICGNGIDDNCDGLTDVRFCGPEEEAPPGCDCASSPIVLEWGNGTIRLTDNAHGVLFDLDANGAPERIAWTAPGEENEGFLALDVNSNGVIDNGLELFGNVSRFPGRRALFLNGFEALKYLDTPEMGGNYNGAIARGDTAFAQLLIWVDRNHNGMSDPGELLPFSDYFSAIEWSYKDSEHKDRYGNIFKWRAKAYLTNGNPVYAYDVFLKRK
jgi:hypothetical protein